ncbi:MAG TPA: RpiB/LacA/LacB family sugar-phosphate isomerase [Candidatus Paceibacterota bacterium]|nr:RpiB/LacA/LacB family sugar-phosphate isomerase [Candidatus Paceibacterota bacterium]
MRLARRHNDANVLSIGARFVSGEEAEEAVHIFLDTPFSDSPRHARRLAKF